jgi:hypothetical protein
MQRQNAKGKRKFPSIQDSNLEGVNEQGGECLLRQWLEGDTGNWVVLGD